MVELTMSVEAVTAIAFAMLASKPSGVEQFMACRDAKKVLEGEDKAYVFVTLADGRVGVNVPWNRKKLTDPKPEPKTYRLENAAFKFVKDSFEAARDEPADKQNKTFGSMMAEAVCEAEDAIKAAKKVDETK